MMKSTNKFLSHFLFALFCLLLNNVQANKKLQRIILASLIGKTLKNHMGGGGHSVMPIIIPPFKSMDKHIDNHGYNQNGYSDNGYNNGYNNGHNNNGYGHSNNGIHSNAIVHANHVQPVHVPTITVHHYHHHTASHNLIEPSYSKYDEGFDGSYNHLIEPGLHHQDYSTYESHDGGAGFTKIIGHSGNSILSGSLGGNVGNILSGQISGGIGRR